MERKAGKRMLRMRSFVLLSSLLLMVSCHHHRDNTPFIRPSVLSLTAGAPVNDFVIRGEFNAYAVSVVPGDLYKISITRVTDDADLLFFGTDFSFTNLVACGVDNTELSGVTAEDCIIVAPGSTLFFGVDGTFLVTDRASFIIAVEPVVTRNLNLSLPVLDSVTQTTAVLYQMPVAIAGAYSAAITGLDNNADLFVFGTNTDFSAPVACTLDNTNFSGTTPEDCTLTLGTGTFFFIVDGIFSSSPTVLYAAFASPAPSFAVPANEGVPGAPVAVVMDTPRAGQAGFNGASYYSVAGALAGNRYTVSINGLTSGANLAVFNDINFTSQASCVINNISFTGTTAEDCTFVAAGTTLFLKVSADTAGVAFITLVEPGP